jgi:periodic tryptophan protein 2
MFAKGTYRIKEKFYCEQKDYAQVSTVNVYRGRKKDVNIAVIGFSSGFFGLYEMPGFNLVHNLSISSTSITGAAINSTGQWLALGASDLGQLLVWEWESETYIIKQQGHFFDVNDCVFSPDGQILASASDEGKVKLWNCDTGFCFITFADHSAPVTALEFSSNGQILFSASLDGTVRAYDLVRYRNFRTFTANTPVQFTCLAIEPSGEVVVAGALEPFNIYVWSLRTGKLIDVMAGHEAPLSGLTFTPVTSLLASSAWDGNVMIWDLFTGKGQVEVLGGENPHDLLALDFRPDGKELCTSCMDGNLYFWDPFNAVLKFTINGRRDMRAGRRANQARSAANSTQSLAFTSVCYSADGDYILAGGNSKFICIYHVKHKILVKKFALSENYSYDGMKEKLNSRYLTDSGATKQALDMNDSDEEDDMIDTRYTPNQQSISLPGVRRGDKSSRRTTGPVMRSKAVCFSPSGQQWAAATTEGVVVYALGQTNTFDPLELDLDITPENCLKALSSREFSSALTMALCLNDMKLIRKCVEKTPVVSVELVLQNVPETRLKPLLSMLSQGITASPHLHFYLIWMKHLLLYHGKYLSSNVQTFSSSLRTFQKALISGRKDLSVICEQNTFQLDYLCKAVQLKKNNIPVAAADDAALEAEEEAA